MITKYRLEQIAKAATAIGSFKEVLVALVEDQTITSDVAGNVSNALDHAALELEPALRANLGGTYAVEAESAGLTEKVSEYNDSGVRNDCDDCANEGA